MKELSLSLSISLFPQSLFFFSLSLFFFSLSLSLYLSRPSSCRLDFATPFLFLVPVGFVGILSWMLPCIFQVSFCPSLSKGLQDIHRKFTQNYMTEPPLSENENESSRMLCGRAVLISLFVSIAVASAWHQVFAAGDCRRGQSLVVWAIREGRDAANAVSLCYDRDLSLLKFREKLKGKN